jgi:hypothetical protein
MSYFDRKATENGLGLGRPPPSPAVGAAAVYHNLLTSISTDHWWSYQSNLMKLRCSDLKFSTYGSGAAGGFLVTGGCPQPEVFIAVALSFRLEVIGERLNYLYL